MLKQYSFANLISGRHRDDEGNWVETPYEFREIVLEKFKDFLLSNTRKNSKVQNAIIRMRTYGLPNNCGLFERLIYNEERDKVEYVAGQDYPSELRFLKDLIKKGMN